MNYQILKNIVDAELQRFQTISEEDWNHKAAPEKWSKKEIIGHICDSAFTNSVDLQLLNIRRTRISYTTRAYGVKAQNYQNVPVSELINLWKSLNYQIVHVVENIPDEALQRTCDTTKIELQRFTLEFIIKDYVDHLQHHLKAI